jgi:hypothetical protein
VETGRALTLSLEIRKNLIGTLVDLFWKLPPVQLKLSSLLSGTGEYRIIPAVAADGIIVAPFLVGSDDVKAFFGPYGLAAGPASVSLVTKYPWMYAPQIGVAVRSIDRLRR